MLPASQKKDAYSLLGALTYKVIEGKRPSQLVAGRRKYLQRLAGILVDEGWQRACDPIPNLRTRVHIKAATGGIDDVPQMEVSQWQNYAGLAAARALVGGNPISG